MIAAMIKQTSAPKSNTKQTSTPRPSLRHARNSSSCNTFQTRGSPTFSQQLPYVDTFRGSCSHWPHTCVYIHPP